MKALTEITKKIKQQSELNSLRKKNAELEELNRQYEILLLRAIKFIERQSGRKHDTHLYFSDYGLGDFWINKEWQAEIQTLPCFMRGI